MSIKNAMQKNHRGRMNGRNIVLLLGSALFLLLGALSLQPQSFDIGYDPERIEVVSIKQITTDAGYDLINTKWSPDGKYFAAIKGSATYIFDEDGKLFKKFEDIKFGNWAPDSKRILCPGMILLNIETGERRKIEGNGFSNLPSGDKIIYCSEEGLSVSNINTGEVQVLANAPDQYFTDIFYASDDKIFYTKKKRGPFDTEPYLYRYNSLTKKEFKLLAGPVYGPKYLLTSNGQVRISASREKQPDSFSIIDENGEIIGRIPRFILNKYLIIELVPRLRDGIDPPVFGD